jgi:hypothetical protein
MLILTKGATGPRGRPQMQWSDQFKRDVEKETGGGQMKFKNGQIETAEDSYAKRSVEMT